ncbi:MAG TPA: enoyl-CoA hydratase [Sphingomicrobium sp.]|jgi:enoyl-CoA hydratase/carnithine racemase|nr:enoyl-CoA hydratase [Sphingomicrobium sp.]
MNEHVVVEKRGPVLSIALARPERRNAITVAMYAAIAEAVEEGSADASVRVMTIRGEGPDFAAGNDLADFLQEVPGDREEIAVWRLLRALAACETPLVAAVHGNCVGIGTTMLLHCDLVVAEEGTRFSLPFVDLGLVPEAASSLLFPEMAGRRLAARYLLLGEPFGVKEAISIGLVSHDCGAGTLDQMLGGIIDSIIAKPQGALRATQHLLRHGEREAILERMRLEGSIFAERLKSSEVKEAITAFFEKRKPDFSSAR